MVQFSINGKSHSFDGDMDMPLLWFIRQEAKLKGTKFGCGIASCGACTIHLNGEATRCCILPMGSLSDGDEITTIEGLKEGENFHPVQQAWIAEDVPQCGYCQAGQIMATVDFLRQFPNPTDEQINQNITNLCRCGTYNRIRKAIHKAAQILQAERAET